MTYQTAQKLSGMRAFVVEADPLIALDVAFSLQDAGAEVFGPYPNCAAALDALRIVHKAVGISVAVLDVNLGPETSEPVARALSELGVPILFHTSDDPSRVAGYVGFKAPVIRKPSSQQMLIAGVLQCFEFPVKKRA